MKNSDVLAALTTAPAAPKAKPTVKLTIVEGPGRKENAPVVDKSDKVNKVDKADKAENVENVDKTNKHAKAEKVEKADEDKNDHERFIGHMGVSWFGVSQIPLGIGKPAGDFNNPSLTLGTPTTVAAPAIGIRYWFN